MEWNGMEWNGMEWMQSNTTMMMSVVCVHIHDHCEEQKDEHRLIMTMVVVGDLALLRCSGASASTAWD